MTKFEKIAKILADNRGIDISIIKEDTSFSELKLDSLDVVDLLMTLEDEFGVEIEMNANIKTISDVVACIESTK